MAYEDDRLLEKLRIHIDELHGRRFAGDPLVHNKILALSNYADFIMGLTQPISIPPTGSTSHTAQLSCPLCSGVVNVTLS
jgi:hypothetical protein